MHIARFWTRAQAFATARNGKKIDVEARGWSDDNIESARQCALDIARKVADRVAAGLTNRGRYPYGDRPLPEPVVREFTSDGAQSAIVTRNGYGALVLNAVSLMFVDIDDEQYSPKADGVAGLAGLFGSLFRKPKQPEPEPARSLPSGIADAIAQRGCSARAYETAAGFRLMITSAPFAPGSVDSESLLQQLGCDPLYIRLCRSQGSFRARLSPKPWRCRTSNPPVEFPFETPQTMDTYNRWLVTYETNSSRYATCRYLTTLGGDDVAPQFAPLVEFHDSETRATSGLKLA
ncbi:MAG: hypothetical protein JOY86_07220 [Candidatus Eremiobacteraeota bacterium]|nr:hypothetical protein [Candidatus Eremiobacteraeota bacterium]